MEIMTKKPNPGNLYVISAPSGGGKTTLVNALLSNLNKEIFKKVITFTSRTPRSSEVNGIDYHFISILEFQKKIEEGFFIEWSLAYGTYYGCPKYILDEVKAGVSYFAIVDRNGAQAIKSICPESILIWLTPPNLPTLKKRLVNRATEAPEQIEYRLNLAEREIAAEDQEPIFTHKIVNDNFDFTLSLLAKIIGF